MLSEYKKSEDVHKLILEKDIMSILFDYYKFEYEVYNVNIFVEGKKIVGAQKNSVCSVEMIKDEKWFENLSSLDQININ